MRFALLVPKACVLYIYPPAAGQERNECIRGRGAAEQWFTVEQVAGDVHKAPPCSETWSLLGQNSYMRLGDLATL